MYMKCRLFKNQRILYLYGELKYDSEFRKHIAVCESCKDEISEMSEIISSYRETSSQRLYKAPIEKILNRIKQEKKISISRLRVRLTVAALILIAILFPLFIKKGGDEIRVNIADGKRTNTKVNYPKEKSMLEKNVFTLAEIDSEIEAIKYNLEKIIRYDEPSYLDKEIEYIKDKCKRLEDLISS